MTELKKFQNYWKERIDLWKNTDSIYSYDQLKSMSKSDSKFETKIKQLVSAQTRNKCVKQKFKKFEQVIIPLMKKYEEIMPKAKDEIIRFLGECNDTLTETTEIEYSENTTELVENVMPKPTKVLCLNEAVTSKLVNYEITEKLVNILIPKPTKVVCISEASKSEVVIFQIPEKFMRNLIPHPRKVVYLREYDHDITAEPSDN
ncbi:unnamed protein product, partial [Meganyctiphanes norvegica]